MFRCIRRSFELAVIAIGVVLCPHPLKAAVSPERKPNLIVVLADDLGYGDVHCYGATSIQTPRLDRMAAEGARLTTFYAAAPICSPSRAALLTACYPKRVGITRVLGPTIPIALNPAEVTLAEVLATNGYATACIGKWHLGHLPPFLPLEQGFQSFYGLPYSNDMTMDPRMAVARDCVWREGMTLKRMLHELPRRDWVPLMRGDDVVEYPADQASLTERFTAEAISFIKANREKPFFLYVAHMLPHVPISVSERLRGKSASGLYGDAVECIDWSTGEILDTLMALGLDRSTVVVFTSDNGPRQEREVGASHGSAAPFSGWKRSTAEGGVRVPCIWWAPGWLRPGTTRGEMVQMMDIYPTFCALAQAAGSRHDAMDGTDVWSLLMEVPGATAPHRTFYYYGSQGDIEGMRSGRWKLRGGEHEHLALYDLEADAGEATDIAASFPSLVRDMKARMDAFDSDLTHHARPAAQISER